MLLEFKVANFQCFRDEVTLSMLPGAKDKTLKGNQFQSKKNKVLKAAGIWGHNASGKSSLLQALQVMREFVVNSATKMNIGDLITGIDPFRLASDTADKPSSFEVLLELDGDEYRYTIKVTTKQVIEENLEYRNSAKASRVIQLFSRQMSTQNNTAKIYMSKELGDKDRVDSIVKDTRINGLILSRAAERNVEIIHPLYDWFRNCIRFLFLNSMSSNDILIEILIEIAEKAQNNEEFKNKLSQLIGDADTGIVMLDTGNYKRESHNRRIALSSLDVISGVGNGVGLQYVSTIKQFYTYHKLTDTDEVVRFRLDYESQGTQQFLAVAGVLLDCCMNGKLLIIDELDTSLHTQLAMRLIQLVHNQEFNHTGAQLIFSTHDTNLMDLDLLRRDQIWITQKNANGEGELYSLWDFEDKPRNNTPLARNYLAGRYGGIPVFGSQLEDIPQSDEPTIIKYTEND